MAEAVRAEGCRVMSSPLSIAVSAVLCGKGYTAREANYGVNFFKTNSVAITKSSVIDFADHAEIMIDLLRDGGRVGTTAYEGLAYFWAYKYRFWMRGDAHCNGYKGKSIKRARRKVHATMLAEHLPLDGETSRHDEIVNGVFGMSEYKQEGN